MAIESHIHRRGGIYQFRVRIPQDIAGNTNLKEIRFSLRTACPKAARRLGQAGRLAMIRCFDELRRMTDQDDGATPYYLTNKQIRDLAREYFLQEISRDEIFRVNAREFGAELEKRQLGRLDEEKVLRQAIAGANTEIGHPDADDMLAYHGIQPGFNGEQRDIPSNMYNQLCFTLLRARLAANLVAQAHDRGDFSVIPPDPLFQDITSTDFNLADRAIIESVMNTAVPRPRLTERQQTPLSDVWKLAVAEKKTLTTKTKGDYENAFKWLIQVVGDKPIGGVTEDDLLAYKDKLLKAPSNFRKKLGTDNLVEAVNRNAKLPRPHPVMTSKTVNLKYLGAIREVFDWARENNYTVNKTNPGAEIRVKVVKGIGSTKERLPFSMQQLQKMFETPLYMGCKSASRLFEPGEHRVRDHHYWVPLLALFSGCRLNELGQMEIDDIDNFNGRLHLNIRTQRDPEEAGDELDVTTPDRTLKTAAARRRVPVHDELINIGFVDFLHEIKEKSDRGGNGTSRRLFPGWNPSRSKQDNYYSSVFSKWFNERFLKKHQLKSKQHVFHSLRHNFKDALRNSAVTDETQNRYMGHSSRHVGERYGAGDLVRAQSDEIDKLYYEGLDLSHLHALNPSKTLKSV
jgi:integrase